MSDAHEVIPSIFGPDDSSHVRQPFMAAFTPVNSDQSFKASPREPQFFKATPAQKKAAVETQEEELIKANISNLGGLVTVLHEQISRTSNSPYRPTTEELVYAIDQLRIQASEEKLDKDWKYGFLLWILLDPSSQRSFRTFHTFEDLPGGPRGRGRLSLDFFENPYAKLVRGGYFPSFVPSLDADHVDDFLQKVQHFNKFKLNMANKQTRSSNRAAPSETASSVSGGAATPANPVVIKAIPKRWKTGDPQTSDYYWDEKLPNKTLLKTDDPSYFPPQMDLSDAWVAVVIEAGFTAKERAAKYPAVFASKYLKPDYTNKGRAAKVFSTLRNEWVYKVACNIYQLCGAEGVANGIDKNIDLGLKMTSKKDMMEGQRCFEQSYDYTPPPSVAAVAVAPRRKKQTTKRDTRAHPIGLLQETQSEPESTTSNLKRQASAVINKIAKKAKKQVEVKAATPTGSQNRTSGRITVPDYSDDEEEAVEAKCENCASLQTEIGILRAKLYRAEGKLVFISETLERVHRTFQPLVDRLATTARLIRTVVKLKDLFRKDDTRVIAKADDLKALEDFAKNGKKELTELIQPCNNAQDKLRENFPVLETRVFYHSRVADEPCDEFIVWRDGASTEYSKLFDEGDKVLHHNGREGVVKERAAEGDFEEPVPEGKGKGRETEESEPEDEELEDGDSGQAAAA